MYGTVVVAIQIETYRCIYGYVCTQSITLLTNLLDVQIRDIVYYNVGSVLIFMTTFPINEYLHIYKERWCNRGALHQERGNSYQGSHDLYVRHVPD